MAPISGRMSDASGIFSVPAGIAAAGANVPRMPTDLSTMLMRRSAGAVASHTGSCERCHRTPLAGELMHELEDHRHVCPLCLARLPESQREPVRSDRVRAAERRIAVVPRAA